MRLLFVLLVCACVGYTHAYKNWAGSNLYYAAGLSQSQQDYWFSNLKSAGVKVVRVWLDGQSSGSTKGTPITTYPSLEHNQIGQYDDTVLNLMDGVMLNAYKYGIKLMISIHSFNALQAGDVYGQVYGTGYFYEQQSAISAFDNRIRHVLNHNHKSLGKQWKDLKDYIFAFEAQNEAMIGKGQDYIASHQYWQCDRAQTIKSVLGSNSGILVTTGGESWVDESMQPDWFTCPYLDIIAMHAYGTGDFDTNKLANYVKKGQQYNKKIIMQEWGACYFTTSNNDCPAGSQLNPSTRGNNIKNWANQIANSGMPWMYWQIIPNKDPHYGYDYEIGIDDQNWDDFKAAAQSIDNMNNSPWDWSGYLLP